MSLTSLIVALPIFFLVYQGVGLWLDSRSSTRWSLPSQEQPSFSIQKVFTQLSHVSAGFKFNKMLLQNKSLRTRLELLLLRSGHPFGWTTEDFLLFKEVGAVLILLMLWRMEVTPYMVWPFLIFIGFWLPDAYMQAKVTARQASIQRQLPGFVDLLCLALESGLDIMSAVERILEKMKPSGLREELFTLLQENRLGTTRKESLTHLAFRTHLPDVQSLTSIIIQSEELGTSLASVLRNYTEDMRSKRILRAEEVAGKAPVKLLFPMMVFFFPIVFVIIFGPLALNFVTSYK